VDAVVGCQGGLSTTSSTGEDGSIEVVRLNNVGAGDCTEQAFMPVSLELAFNAYNFLFDNGGADAGFAILAEWDTEDKDDDLMTRVSWSAVEPVWETCVPDPTDPDEPACFELLACEGTPLRFCGADEAVDDPPPAGTGLPLFACVEDKDCSQFDPAHQSCDLIDLLEPPEDDTTVPPTPGWEDMDERTEGFQYSCRCGTKETYLGTVGRNGIDEGVDETTGEPLGDDTAEEHHLIQECIFVRGDARGRRN
jgi:hypothetical protein